MSTDWIKMRVDLRTHPKVVRLSSALRADKLRVIGALFSVWAIFDAHSSDGLLDGYTFQALDAELGWKGFAQAMAGIGWLEEAGEEGLLAPRFGEHNGQSAKRRAQETARKAASRAEAGDDRTRSQRVADWIDEMGGQMSASDADTLRAREEKRREEENPHSPPDVNSRPTTKRRRPKAEEVTLAEWLDQVHAKGEKAIPTSDTVFAYADAIGLPREFLHLAWAEFKARYTAEPVKGQRPKTYTDWRAVFRKAVKEGWLRLWFLDGQQYALTTAGQQAQRLLQAQQHRDEVPA